MKKKGNVLCLVDNIATSRKLGNLIKGAKIVNGQDMKDPDKRQLIYDMFNTHNDLVVIATVHIAGTGLSINRIFHLLMIDLGKSFIRVIQAIGRGLRKAHDKDFVNVEDICSDFKYSNNHLKQRISFYKESGYPYKKISVKYKNID